MELNENNDSKELDKNDSIVSEWLMKFYSNTLTESDFRHYWKTWVHRLLKPEVQDDSQEWSVNEQKIQQTLFNTLEEFICNGSNTEVLRGSSQHDYLPSVCGHLFKVGEPIFICQECGMDNTSKLCVDCFEKSSHKNHNYKMKISENGGFCDCGDKEVWKQDAHCQTHELGLEKKHVSLNFLTRDMEKRANLVFKYVLRYAHESLTFELFSNLPTDLNSDKLLNDLFNIQKNQEDRFCTVIYDVNKLSLDFIPTIFDSCMQIPQRKSIDYLTSFDLEGRVIVKCADFVNCKDLKENFEDFLKSIQTEQLLKVAVVHSYVIANQTYALRLLTWMENLLKYSRHLRTVFSEVVIMSTLEENCILESVLQIDNKLWKSARLHWHKLFIAGMFVEYDSKKKFAEVFTRNYEKIMKNFMNADHEYSYSITSFGVQIFTVPALTNHLMVHHDVLFQLLKCYLLEILPHIKPLKHNFILIVSATYKLLERGLYVINDICHLLDSISIAWNSKLRKSFCHGIPLFLEILSYINNLDPIFRSCNRKIIEYSPDWETVFHSFLQFKPIITKILFLSGSDNDVLNQVYRMTLEKMLETPDLDPRATKSLAVKELIGYKVDCIKFDVSIGPISFHIPLFRFFAGLNLYLDRHGLSFENSEWLISHPPKQIIEPSLRVLVLISQIYARMWETSTTSLKNLIEFYYSANYSLETFDKDIVILQIGASLIDSNEFLIHLLNKFDLLEWVQPSFDLFTSTKSEDESIRQTVRLAEDFLSLLIYIVGERYTLGVGKVTFDDCLKNEVIQQLCIEPTSYLELSNIVLKTAKDKKHLERIINEVAIFKKTEDKSVYELKPEYYNDYNLFFYHYSKPNMYKSENNQKERRKSAGQPTFCPPPSLPLFNDAFLKTANIMQCNVMLHIMKLILDRAINLNSSSYTESQLHKVLHLIGYALYEEQKRQSSTFNFTELSVSYGLEIALDEFKRSPRITAHKDLTEWVLNKFKEVSAHKRKNEKVGEIVVDMEKVKSEDIENQNHERSKLVANKRANVLAEMAQMQNNFMENNATLYENTPTNSESDEELKNNSELGLDSTSYSNFVDRYTCMLCREEELITRDCQAMVLASFVQKSSVLCQVRNISEDVSNNTLDPYYIPVNFGPSPHVSTCGHAMHFVCWQTNIEILYPDKDLNKNLSFDVSKNEYFCPLCERLSNAVIPLLPPTSSFTERENMKKFEFLTFENWLDGLNIALKQCKVAKPETSESISVQHGQRNNLKSQTNELNRMFFNLTIIHMPEDNEEEISAPPNQFSIDANNYSMQILKFDNSTPKVLPKVPIYKNSKLSPSLVDTTLKFARSIYSKATDINPHPDNSQILLMTWKACAYTIHSIEVILRYKNTSLLGELSYQQEQVMEAMVRISGILSSIWNKQHEINLHAFRLLSMAINNGGNNSIGILDWDAFGMLVSLTMTLPSLYYSEVPGHVPKGTELDFFALRLMFIANLVQIILTINIEDDSGKMLEDDPEADTFCIANLVYKLRGIVIKNTAVVWNSIKNCSIPFLRCCVLFYHFLTGVPASDGLTEVNGDTYYNMCCYLKLPTTCKELLDKPYVEVLINKWAENTKLIKIKQGEQIPFKVWTHINQLIQLPDDYSELINTVSKLTCPNSKYEDLSNPTICLVCGEMLCSQRYCCRSTIKHVTVGGCFNHANSCGSGVGVFLRVHTCELLLLAIVNKGHIYSAPYMDKYGEIDQGLKRGNPLYLCKKQYRKLQLLWLDHKLHEEIYKVLQNKVYAPSIRQLM